MIFKKHFGDIASLIKNWKKIVALSTNRFVIMQISYVVV